MDAAARSCCKLIFILSMHREKMPQTMPQKLEDQHNEQPKNIYPLKHSSLLKRSANGSWRALSTSAINFIDHLCGHLQSITNHFFKCQKFLKEKCLIGQKRQQLLVGSRGTDGRICVSATCPGRVVRGSQWTDMLLSITPTVRRPPWIARGYSDAFPHLFRKTLRQRPSGLGFLDPGFPGEWLDIQRRPRELPGPGSSGYQRMPGLWRRIVAGTIRRDPRMMGWLLGEIGPLGLSRPFRARDIFSSLPRAAPWAVM